MRYGLTILPEFRWADAAPKWRAAEELGFDHAWTYDHLVWAGLPDSAWFGALPTLTGAAMATTSIRLGTLVSSPNYRHPYVFARDLIAVDDISEGRLICGLGTGGDLDARILGEDLPLGDRVSRFEEYVALLDNLLTDDHVDHAGTFYRTVDARTRPGPVQRPRIPFLVAANGPRALAVAARHGQGWVTTGPPAEDLKEWFAGVGRLASRVDDALAAAGRDGVGFRRFLLLDASPQFSLASLAVFEDMAGQARDLGFTDVVTHFPRPDGPYAGRLATLEEVAGHLPAER